MRRGGRPPDVGRARVGRAAHRDRLPLPGGRRRGLAHRAWTRGATAPRRAAQPRRRHRVVLEGAAWRASGGPHVGRRQARRAGRAHTAATQTRPDGAGDHFRSDPRERESASARDRAGPGTGSGGRGQARGHRRADTAGRNASAPALTPGSGLRALRKRRRAGLAGGWGAGMRSRATPRLGAGARWRIGVRGDASRSHGVPGEARCSRWRAAFRHRRNEVASPTGYRTGRINP